MGAGGRQRYRERDADATAAADHPEMGDGYAAALTNSKFISSGVLTTEDAIKDLAA